MDSELTARRRGLKAAKDFKEYLELVIRIKPAAHQGEWLEACQDIGNGATGQRYCIIAPPGRRQERIYRCWVFIVDHREESHPTLWHAFLCRPSGMG